MRNYLIKEYGFEDNCYISENRFVAVVEQFLKIENFRETELYNKMLDCLTDEVPSNEDILVSMKQLNLLVDMYHYTPIHRKNSNL